MKIEHRRLFFSLFFLAFFVRLSAQSNYPQGYFRDPLAIPIQLAANFGELRPDHFHMGLDIRTESKENLPVYAAADGYVSHIRIEKNGYGRAIFITHPNGYTTLYAHLNRFFDGLETYVKEKQYNDEKWNQDFSIPKGLFPVAKGQFIAYSGNTGASQGPHLHFEIRDTKTGNNINPLLFGFDVPDDIPPVIYSLSWYDRRYSIYSVHPQPVPIVKTNETYATRDSIVKISSPVFSFGINMEDLNNTSPFRYGVYHAALRMDDSLLFEFKLNNFLYDDSRYVNASMDYSTWVSNDRGIQHLSVLPGNRLQIFTHTGSDGKILLKDSSVHTIQILVSDENENESIIQFLVRYDDSLQKQYSIPAGATVCMPLGQNNVETAHAKLHFDEKAFYDAVPFVINESEAQTSNQVSPTIHAASYLIPVHSAYDISIKVTKPFPDSLKDKVVMKLITGSSKRIATGEWENDRMLGSFDELGDVSLVIDTIAPAVTPVGWRNGSVVKSKQNLIVSCKDDQSRIETFRAELDGSWLMFSRKNDYFIYTFDEHCSGGGHNLVITATDVAGNSTTRSFNFVKQ
ncbi:MAG TPA: M23 family metallopeptidase [Parafilimonas sp.]|nr:M23 family metallopeptidase [Parafilimonas sp.]